MSNEVLPPRQADTYSGLPQLLHAVRWTQGLLSIVAEVLILLAFAMSGMDVSLGGIMAGVPLLKVLWAAMFALGIDTAFALSWVRVRQAVAGRRWLALAWNLPLALGMAVIVFEPVAVQLLQQALAIGFNQALAVLGINLTVLVYARAAVAVFLGAILAMTNVEGQGDATQAAGPPRRIILFEQLLNRVAPVVRGRAHATLPAQTVATVDIAKLPTGPLLEQVAAQPSAAAAQPVQTVSTLEQRAASIRALDVSSLSAEQRVQAVLAQFPDISDRELGKLSGVAPATAKKHRASLSAPAHE